MKLTVRTAPCAVAAFLLAGLPAAAQDYKEVEFPGTHADQPAAWRSDTAEIKLGPKDDPSSQVEYTVRMKRGDALVYTVSAPDAADLWHEFHGHAGETLTYYKKAEGGLHHGSLSAPFEGEHSWYLENRSSKPVTVTVKLAGFYEPPPAE